MYILLDYAYQEYEYTEYIYTIIPRPLKRPYSHPCAAQRILTIIRITAYSHDHTQLALVAMAIDERVEDLLHDLADAVVANHRHLDERVEKG